MTNDLSSIGTFRVLPYRMLLVIHVWMAWSFDWMSTVLCSCPASQIRINDGGERLDRTLYYHTIPFMIGTRLKRGSCYINIMYI
jgi:hypothetical protein